VKRHLGIILLSGLAACTLAVLPTETHAAATTPLPASLYPAHTTLFANPSVTNTRMDCDWSFTCSQGHPLTQRPIFHFTTEDALQRVSGWAQFGTLRIHGQPMRFAIYASRYVDGEDAEGLPWSLRAFIDFRLTTLAHGFSELNHDPALIPPGVLGTSGAQILRSPKQDVLDVACWTGSIEVEAVAIFAHGDRGARAIALHDLVRQVRTAMRQDI
jgi:hypothetical protein